MKKNNAGWMAALLATAVLSPGIAYATAGTLVNISDPSTSASAKVDVSSLRVVTVAPTQQASTSGALTSTTTSAFVASTSLSAIHLTNLNLMATGTTAPVTVYLYKYNYNADQALCGTTAASSSLRSKWTIAGGQGMVPLNYSPGLVSGAGKQCLRLTIATPPSGVVLYWSATTFQTAT